MKQKMLQLGCVRIVLVKCWSAAHLNVKKLLKKIAKKLKKSLPKYLDIFK